MFDNIYNSCINNIKIITKQKFCKRNNIIATIILFILGNKKIYIYIFKSYDSHLRNILLLKY